MTKQYFDQQSLWNQIEQNYQHQVRQDILMMLPDNVKSILDAGCGDGYITNTLPPEIMCVGVDMSFKALQSVNDSKSLASVSYLPFPDNSFDMVMVNDVMEHIADSMLEQTLNELQRVAKRYLLITVPFGEDIIGRMTKCASCGKLYHINHHQRSYSLESVATILGNEIKPIEIRFSGDITRTIPDPWSSTKHNYNLYEVYSEAKCPECGASSQIMSGLKDVKQTFDRIVTHYRADYLSKSGPWHCRSEAIALFDFEQFLYYKEQSPEPFVVMKSLLEVDFQNPLQMAVNFVVGTLWSRYSLSSGLILNNNGVTRKIGSNSAYVDLQFPVNPQPNDKIIFVVKGTGSIAIYNFSYDTTENLKTIIDVSESEKPIEIKVGNELLVNKFGFMLRIYLQDQVILQSVTYVSTGDISAYNQPFIKIHPGHQAYWVQNETTRYSWGYTSNKTGFLPLNPMGLSTATKIPEIVADTLLNSELDVVLDILKYDEKQLTTLSSNYASINSQYQSLETDRDELLQQYQSLETNRDELLQQYQSLETNRDELLQQYNSLLQDHQIEVASKSLSKFALKGIKKLYHFVRNASAVTEFRRNYTDPWMTFEKNEITLRPSQKKILVIASMFPHPDQPYVGSFVHEQIKALMDRGVDVRVISGRPFWTSPLKPLAFLGQLRGYKKSRPTDWYTLEGVPIKYFPYLILSGSWSHSTTYSMAVKQVFKQVFSEFPFNIIHAHSSYLDGSIARSIGKELNIPYVITAHMGPFSVQLNHPIKKRVTIASLEHADKIIAVSHAQKNNVGTHLSPENHQSIEVIPNGVDIEKFHVPDKWNPDPQHPRILFVGYFEAVKNIFVLLNAIKIVRKTIPGVQLRLVGGGTLQPKIEDFIKQDDLQDHVIVEGYFDRDNIAEIMREECDLLVLPSQSETFGIVIIEALASGKPVVATRCGGPEDIITQHKLGELCEVNSAEALADSLLNLIQRLPDIDPSYLRKHVVDNFSYDVVAKTLIDLYDEILVSG